MAERVLHDQKSEMQSCQGWWPVEGQAAITDCPSPSTVRASQSSIDKSSTCSHQPASSSANATDSPDIFACLSRSKCRSVRPCQPFSFRDWKSCWYTVLHSASDIGFHRIRLQGRGMNQKVSQFPFDGVRALLCMSRSKRYSVHPILCVAQQLQQSRSHERPGRA